MSSQGYQRRDRLQAGVASSTPTEQEFFVTRSDPTDRERSLELLRAAHEFPGPFQFRIVIHPGKQADVLAALTTAIDRDGALGDVSTRSSRNGRFLSLRATVDLETAEEVLAVYGVLRQVEGVITVF